MEDKVLFLKSSKHNYNTHIDKCVTHSTVFNEESNAVNEHFEELGYLIVVLLTERRGKNIE